MEDALPLRKVGYKNRPGFDSSPMRWLYRSLAPFFHCRANLPRELQESTEPVVFVANHYNAFGPISFVHSVPAVCYFWSNAELLNPGEAEDAFRPGMRQMFPFLGEKALNWLCRKMSALACRVLTRLGAIPVDRNRPATLISTMRKSIQTLQEGSNLLIFPETGLPEYSLTSVTPFFSGFAALGRLYYRKTGKTLRFCPCYIDEQHRQIRFGETVTWDPENPDANAETERVSEELNRRIREMAAENRGVEKEKGTPARRAALLFCNLLRAVLLIPLTVMLGIPNPGMILLFYGIIQGLRLIFNVTGSAYASTNRMYFLMSGALDALTNLSAAVYLRMTAGLSRWIVPALILNCAVILASNIHAFYRYRRCAGLNYFDTVSSNLLCLICLVRLTGIPMTGILSRILETAAVFFLLCSAGFGVALNMRIGREEREAPEKTGNGCKSTG